MKVRSISVLVATLLAGTAAQAVQLPIVNAGFEAPYLGGNLPPGFNGDVPATAFPVGAAPTGWQSYGAVGGNAFVGVLNPGVAASIPQATYFPAGAPEGENVALTFYDGHLGGGEFGIVQTLGDTLSPNTHYSLRVAVGNIASGVSVVQPYASFGYFDLRGFPGYRVELLAGSNVIASDNNRLRPDEGAFLTTTVELIVSDTHPRLSQPLGIRLVNVNAADVIDPVVDLEVDFDAVELEAVPFDSTGVTGDYNNDGQVDGGDYVVWRDRVGGYSALPNDLIGGQIGPAHFAQWRSHHGGQIGSAAGSAQPIAGVVPEPASATSFVSLGITLLLRHWRRARCAGSSPAVR